MREILITEAMIYANGPLHLGHLLGYIQSDIFARFQRMNGNKCYYIGGADTHGTPIMLKAQENNMSPEDFVKEKSAAQLADFEKFHIQFDSYHPSNSERNKDFTEQFYKKMQANGDIVKKTISQAYDAEKEMFLPDRFVKGSCPKCKKPDQYGDSCESCGSTYSPTDLIDPVSTLSGKPPTQKDSEHYFFKLKNYQDKLKTYLNAGHVQKEVLNKLNEWLDADLQDWDISRDKPYYGFKIPGTEDKYFYVWVDAPIAYLASFEEMCEKTGEDFNKFWTKDTTTELIHVVGKDITYFLGLFWPAILMSAGKRLPTRVQTHGLVTINGEKMSKSRGTFITANRYAKHLSTEYLRYYYATKISSGNTDIDLNLEDYTSRVNSDLVGKVINIASRSAGFIRKGFDNKLCNTLEDDELFEEIANAAPEIGALYESFDYGQAVRKIMSLADLANQFIEKHAPWSLVKEPGNEELVHRVCTQAINCFRHLVLYLKPIMPELAMKTENFLNIEPLVWGDFEKPLLDHQINKFKPMMMRIDPETVKAMENDAD